MKLTQLLISLCLGFGLIAVSWLLGKNATSSLKSINLSDQSPSYFLAKVDRIISQRELPQENGTQYFLQTVDISAYPNGEHSFVPLGSEFQPLNKTQLVKPGQTVVAATQQTAGQTDAKQTIIVDIYRLPILNVLFIGFIFIVLVLVNMQGILSLFGMIVSLAVLFLYMIPSILTGASPLTVSLTASGLIAASTIYLSHGFHKASHLSFISLLGTLSLVAILATATVTSAHFVGLGSEEAAFLQFGTNLSINLRGLLLGGIIIGSLGVLDDIIVSQVSVVSQLIGTNSKISFTELYARALTVGKDHISSLVNTLVLAYAGTNLPLFLLFYIDHQTPWWVMLNNETIAEEILRTLVGTIGLIMAVPLTTFIASTVLLKNPAQLTEKKSKKKSAQQSHQHTHLGHTHD